MARIGWDVLRVDVEILAVLLVLALELKVEALRRAVSEYCHKTV